MAQQAQTANAPKHKIDLSFACRDLVDLDVVTKTDPFLMVFEQVGGHWTKIGETEVVYNNLNPQFSTSFMVDFFFENKQPFKVEVYHHDSATKNVLIGTVEFLLSNLMGLKDDILEREIVDTVHGKKDRGTLLARFDRIEKSTTVRLTVHGKTLASKRWCGANNNMLEIYKPKSSALGLDCRDYLTCKIPETDWILVDRTDHIANNKVAAWPTITIHKSKLCSNDDDLPLLFKVMDYRTNSGDHKLVGAAVATLRDLKAKVSAGGILLQKKERKDHRGSLEVVSLAEDTEHDFVDYLKGGLNIALFIGIDFTASNGMPTNSSSLHYVNPNKAVLNPYQLVVKEVGEILLDYDDDKLVPVYGFGADLRYPQLTSKGVSHSFPCTGVVGADEVFGIQGIFEVYEYAHRHITLNGPTHFAPLFRDILAKTRARFAENPDNYSFFLIVTDGEIHDMIDTVGVLVDACDLPISVVIVGVGNESFDNMRRLDSGDVVDKMGRAPKRDICRFVRFNDFKSNKEALRREVLYEIPGQIVEYYKSIGRPPNEPRSMARSFNHSNRDRPVTNLVNVNGISVAMPRTAADGTLLAPAPFAYLPPPITGPGAAPLGPPGIMSIGIPYPAPPGDYGGDGPKDLAKRPAS